MKIKYLIASLVLLAGSAFGQSQFSGGGGSTGTGGSGTVSACGTVGANLYSSASAVASCDINVVDNGSGLVTFSGTGQINGSAVNGPFLILASTCTNSSFQAIGAASNTGFCFPNTSVGAYETAGIENIQFASSSVSLNASVSLAWTASGGANGTKDTTICRLGAGTVEVNPGTGCGAAGFVKTGQSLQVVTSDVSNASATFATITGLSVTLPLFTANWSFSCDIVYSQATAAAANQIGVQTATFGATNLTASAIAYTAATVTVAGAVTDVGTTTTAQSVVTFTPGTTGVKMPIHLSGTIEGASVLGTVLNIQALTGSTSDALTFYRGSSCWLY
jgi:hypothetical protein